MNWIRKKQQLIEGDEWTLPTARDQVLSFRWRTLNLDLHSSFGVLSTKRPSHDAALNSILTEAMLAHAEARSVSFSRHKDYYTGLARYHGPAYTYTRVLKAVDELARLDLIIEERSSRHQRGHQSRLRAAPKLVEGWTTTPIVSNDHEIIRLRGQNGNLIDYSETDNTRRMRRELSRMNADLATFRVGLDATDAGVIWTSTHLIVDDQHYRLAPPTLFRGFNRGSFTKGGRAYGWWQNLPKVRRAQVLINGEPTAEPDFIQMHAAMLYAERGSALDGDAYQIGDFPRDIVKLAFQVLLNTASRQGTISALMNKEGWSLTGAETGAMISALAQRHTQIADSLHADRGIDLMRLDSEITVRTLGYCLNSGIPALPIHDSMLTPRRHESRVAEFMERSAAEVLKSTSSCKVRVSSIPVPQTLSRAASPALLWFQADGPGWQSSLFPSLPSLDVSSEVRLIRERLGFSRRTMAGRIGCDEARIARVERGSGRLGLWFRHRLQDLIRVAK